MKWQVLTALGAFAVCGCAAPVHHYAGSPGSIYDKDRDPPVAAAVGGYDALKPMPQQDFGNSGSPAPVPVTPPAPTVR